MKKSLHFTKPIIHKLQRYPSDIGIDDKSPTLYKDRYRIASARRRGWNYTANGKYFVTICTKGKTCWFGKCKNGYVCLSDIGTIVINELLKTEIVRRNVCIDTWIIMPNHVHAIIVIHDQPVETPRRGVSTTRTDFHHLFNRKHKHHYQWKSQSLGSIINQFKSVCTKRIRIHEPDFRWQARFHDRVIRNTDELQRIRQYIHNNPTKWIEDDLFV